MGKTVEDLRKEGVLNNFYEISQIPRPSFHEERISNYVAEWARKRNFYVKQDKHNNVLIRKAASEGNQEKKGIILQAHMDMVCEKAPDSEHDFFKDAITWQVDGDLLHTGGRTTLGADDGIGMALAMAALEDDSFQHPMLEVLFTTAEEEDLSGAAGFDAGLLQGEYLINLDHTKDCEIVCGSCGGEAVEIRLPVEREKLSESWYCYELQVTGLLGGHSGEDIHRGRGNANKILGRILLELQKKTELKIAALEGGSFRLAIPREAGCVIAFPKEHRFLVETCVESLCRNIKKEYQKAGEALKISFHKWTASVAEVCDADRIITLLALSPDGIWEMSSETEYLVNSSDNLGELHLNKTEFKMVFELRSASYSARKHMEQVIGRLASLTGASCEVHSEYPGWEYRRNSVLREKAIEAFREVNGSVPKTYCVHAGLECGCFFAQRPELDAISIGPDCWGLHSPQESLSIASTKKVYNILTKILEKMCS